MTKTHRVLGLGCLLALVGSAGAQSIDPAFATNYTFADLGSIPGVPTLYGGITTVNGDPSTLLIGGNANTIDGAIYSVGLVRDANNHITGFSGPAVRWGEGAYNDGGLTYAPNGALLASRWPVNQLGMSRAGSHTTDKIVDLAALGVESSHAALNFIPLGHPGANKLKTVSWEDGEWGELTIVPDGTGTYDVTGYTAYPASRLGGGPEGFAFVPIGSPLFPNPTMILSEYSAGMVSVFDLDANGDPIVATRRLFMDGLTGAEGAFIDTLTGDFVFSTFGGGDRVVVVQGFNIPGPAPLTLAIAGLGLAAARRRRA